MTSTACDDQFTQHEEAYPQMNAPRTRCRFTEGRARERALVVSWLIANGHQQIADRIKAGDHRSTKPKEPIYPLAKLAVGDSFDMPAPTLADRKRISRNVSQHGMRHDKGFRCKTDRDTLVMTVTRVR